MAAGGPRAVEARETAPLDYTGAETARGERPDVPWRLGWGPRWLDAALVVLVLLGIVVWVVVDPLTKAPRHIDEGIHAVGARFYVLDPGEHMLHPDYYVGGWPNWKEGAHALLHFPPTPDLVYGTSIAVFGLNAFGFGVPLLLAGLLVALGLYLLGRNLWDHTTGLGAAALFLWSAAGIREGSQFEVEPLITALGVLAVALVAIGTSRRRWWWFAASGASFGLAFLLKLYMGLIPGLVALAFLVRGLREDRPLPVLGRWLVLGLSTLLVGFGHLIWVALVEPGDVPVWEFIYLRSIVERAGVSGSTPIWYYPGVLYRDFAPLVLPILWTVMELVRGRRRRDAEERARRWLFATTLLGIAALFVFSKKESAYLYPLVPFLLLIAGRGLVGLARFAIEPSWRPKALLRGAIACLVAVAGVLVVWFSGFRTTGFDALFVALHTIALSLLAGALVYWHFGPNEQSARLAVGVLAGVAVAWGAVTAAQTVQEHTEHPLQAEARALAPVPAVAEEARPPGVGVADTTFVSSRWQPLSAFLWERGRPWYWSADAGRPWEEQVRRLEPTIRFFHIDKEYRACAGCPPSPEVHASILEWLRHNAEDVTAQVERDVGHALPTYVFRRTPRAEHAAANIGKGLR